jgi:hypothetical protein
MKFLNVAVFPLTGVPKINCGTAYLVPSCGWLKVIP